MADFRFTKTGQCLLEVAISGPNPKQINQNIKMGDCKGVGQGRPIMQEYNEISKLAKVIINPMFKHLLLGNDSRKVIYIVNIKFCSYIKTLITLCISYLSII